MAEKTIEELQKAVDAGNKSLTDKRAKKEAMGAKLEELKAEIAAEQRALDPLEIELRTRTATGPMSTISLAADSTTTTEG